LVFFYRLAPQAAFLAGLYPFLIGETTKITSAAYLAKFTR
jgi:biotin transporter BioY